MHGKASAIYRGTVRHRRLAPARHDFQYPLFLMLLDLDELETLFDGHRFWSVDSTALARFDRNDHYAEEAANLKTAIHDLVEEKSGQRPDGPVRLLTHLRYFGYCFNPISIYYCFNANEQLTDLVLEVNNTPWGERHCYVLPASANKFSAANRQRHVFSKAMHVSPFMPMDMIYDCRATAPAETLYLGLRCLQGESKRFDADLILDRVEITSKSLAKALLSFPLMTLKVAAAIHWQAMRLALKRVPVVPHPGRNPGTHKELV